MNTKPMCINAEDLSTVAAQAVKRALGARQIATELTMEQANQVGGGALSLVLLGPILQGGRINPLFNTGKLALPTLTTNLF